MPVTFNPFTGQLDFNGGGATGAPGPLVDLDASSNPNYPAADKGDRYRVTVAGKVGGASGKVVEAGDVVEAVADNAGGTEASVGTSWIVLQANIAGMTAAGLSMIQAADAAAQQVLLGITGGGAIALGGFTLTMPATGTAALLGTANVFTALQTITQGTANAGILASTGYSLTGSNATSMIDLAGTWNTTGTPTAIKLNITNTASNAASKLFDLQVGSASKFNVGLSGEVFLNGGSAASFARRADVDMLMIHSATTAEGIIGIGGAGYSPGINIRASAQLAWTSDTPASTRDLILVRKEANTLQLGLNAAGVTNQMLTAASRITSDGVGADLTIAAGNGRGAAGGSLILSYYTTAAAATIGTLTTALSLDTTGVFTFADGINMAFNATVGTKIGTATTQKIGFWNAEPVEQQTAIANPSGGGVEDAECRLAVDDILNRLRNIGLIAI